MEMSARDITFALSRSPSTHGSVANLKRGRTKASQCAGIAEAHAICDECGARLGTRGPAPTADSHRFLRVRVSSPGLRCCRCAGVAAHLLAQVQVHVLNA